MAICYHKLSYGNLGGSSSAHAVGYITGTSQIDGRTNVVRNYENRNDVADWGHFTPDDAPDWTKDVGTYWNAVDAHVSALVDKRYLNTKSHEFMKSCARTRQSVIIALPKELGLEDYKAFAQKLYEEVFKPQGCIATYAIHEDQGNPHLHFMSSIYHLEDGQLLENIDRFMYTSQFRVAQRELIGNFFNPILEERGLSERINVKSYKEMGLEIESQVHEGPYARRLAESGKGTRVAHANELISEENRAKILQNTQNMLKLLAANYATFSEKNMYEFISKHMKGDELLTAHVFEKVMGEVVKISGYSRETNLYTTKDYKAHEERAIALSHAMLYQKSDLFVDDHKIESYLEKQDEMAILNGNHTMSDEQKMAVRLLCSDSQLTCLVGRAGTGKTTSLKAVVDLLKDEKIPVFGAAIASEAAQNLENESGVTSRTIASYLYASKKIRVLEEGLEDPDLTMIKQAKISGKIASLKERALQPNSVLIVDEAGMVGVEHFSDLFHFSTEQNIKLILVGDDRQFKSVNSGDLFRYLIEKSLDAGCQTVLSQNYRQAKVPWMSQVSMQFAEMNIIDSLKAYDEHSLIHRFEHEEDLLNSMAKEYMAVPSHESCCVLTYKNEDVEKLNSKIRTSLQNQGRLSTEETIINEKSYAVGDHFIFLKNAWQTKSNDLHDDMYLSIEGKFSKDMKVRNGMRGTILSIKEVESVDDSKPVYCLKVLVKEKGEDHIVSFNTNTVKDFSHGYATTLHKSQGQTVDRTLLYITKNMDLYSTYVAFTRHREHMHAYHLHRDFPTFNTLCDHLGKINVKDLIQDHVSTEHGIDVMEMVEGYKKVGLLISQTIHSASSQEKEALPYLMEEKAYRARLMLNDFSTFGSYLLSRGITQKQLEIAAGLVDRVMSREELEIQATLHAYVDVSKQCRETYEEITKTLESVHMPYHENYGELKDLQERRGELAHLLQQTPVLLRAYSKDILEACHYGLKTIEKQANEYVRHVTRKEVLSKLSYEDREYVQLYEEGMHYEREGRKLFMQNKNYDEDYQELKKTVKPQKLIFKNMISSERLEQQEYIQNAGSGVMYYFKQNPQILSRVLNIIQEYETLDEKEAQKRAQAAERFQDQLLIAKAAGLKEVKAVKDAHILLHNFVCTAEYDLNGKASQTILAQMEAAASLVHRIQEEAQSGGKAVTKAKIMSQVGYEGLITIYNQARDAERLKEVSLGRENIQGEIIALIEYGQAQQEAHRLWKLVREESDQKNCSYEETKHYVSSQQASAQKDIAAFFAVDAYGMKSLNRANALLKEKNLALRLDNLENEAERGRIHSACQLIHNPNAREAFREDARETLLIASLIEREEYQKAEDEKPSRYVFGIMSSYGLSIHELKHSIRVAEQKASLEVFKEALPKIEAYQVALRGFGQAYSSLLKENPNEGAKALKSEKLSPEALAVHEAISVRNEAAYTLYKTNLLQTHKDKDIQGLYKILKVSQKQFMQHVDEHENKHLVSLFKEEADESKKKEVAAHLVEKMNLQFVCQEYSSVKKAILDSGLDMKLVYEYAREVTKYPLLSKSQQEAIKDYERDVEDSRKYHEIAREQQKELALKSSNGKPGISNTAIYETYWNANMDASEKAYHLLQDREVREALSPYDTVTMGRYAHQYETTLMLKAYNKASSCGNPMACLIARELESMLEFEGLPENGTSDKKLMKGTYGLVFAQGLSWQAIHEDSQKIVDAPAITYKDIDYFHTMVGSYLPPHALELVRQSTFTPVFEQTLKESGYESVLEKPSKPYSPMTTDQFEKIMGKELKKELKQADNPLKHQERAMNVVKDASSLGLESEIKSIVSVDISKVAQKQTKFQNTKAKNSQKESSFFQLTDMDKKQINEEYYEKFSDRVNYPSRSQELLIRELFHSTPKLKSKGVYSFGNGWEYHPDGVGNRRGKSVFKSWTETQENLGIYDVAKMKGYCSNYSEFVKFAGEIIGFRQEEFFKEKLSEIKSMRQATSLNVSQVEPSRDYGKHSDYIPFADEQEGSSRESHRKSAKTKEDDGFEPLAVVPKNREKIYPAVLESASKVFGKETMRFSYRNEKGELLGYVIRFEKDGQKSPIPFAFCAQENGSPVWRFKRFNGGVPGTYPIYGLEKLKTHPNAPILFVEGEKAADAAQKLFPDIAVMSWIGGASGARNINFAPIAGRDVMMWPDNDDAGFKAADIVKEKLSEINTALHVIDIPRDRLPKKWDLADVLPENVSFEEVRELINQGASHLRLSKANLTPVFPVPTDAVEMMSSDTASLIQERQGVGVHNEHGNLMYYKLYGSSKDEKEKEISEAPRYLMYCQKGEVTASWQVVDGSIWENVSKMKNTSAVVPLHGLEKLKDLSDQRILIIQDERKVKEIQHELTGKAIVLGFEKEVSIHQLDLTPLKDQSVTWVLNQNGNSMEQLKIKNHEIQSLHPQATVMATNLDTVKPQKILDTLSQKDQQKSISSQTEKQKVHISETFKNSNGLFNSTIAFVDFEEVCERYNLKDLLIGKKAEELSSMIAQSMNDLKNLTSWSSILSLGKKSEELKDQAILSTLMSAYAKSTKYLNNSFNETAMSRRMGFLMARQCIENPKNFDLYKSFVHAEKVEKTFKDKITHDPDQKVTKYTYDDVDKTVAHYNHLCGSAFGKKLPAEVTQHLREKVVNYTKMTPKEATMNTHLYLTGVLMAHELYKATNVHVHRELKTYADVNKLYKDQTQYQELHGKMQSEILHNFEKEHSRSRGFELSL